MVPGHLLADELCLAKVFLHTGLRVLGQGEVEQGVHDIGVVAAERLEQAGINARVEGLQGSLLEGEADQLQV
jgi:hypothetical protein